MISRGSFLPGGRGGRWDEDLDPLRGAGRGVWGEDGTHGCPYITFTLNNWGKKGQFWSISRAKRRLGHLSTVVGMEANTRGCFICMKLLEKKGWFGQNKGAGQRVGAS